MSGRVVRIFLSSTFRDFGEERDLLVRKVFPTLRAKLQSRFVDLVDVDLRWGITEEEAERGEVLPICLSEIDRARPYFIGFLGERYGWVPPPDAYPSHVLDSQSWLEEHRGGKSVTELEILHGVLNNPHMEGRALFYFRSFEYSSSKGGDYITSLQDDQERQSALKETIRQSGFPVYEDYKSPEHLAELLEKDLWDILDREFPASDVPDAFTRENLQHEAYELPRQRLYIGGDKYLTALDKALSEGKQWILVDGPSGGGKSALLANWLQSVRDNDKNIELHAHYLGATADATDPVFLVRRIIECIKRKTESTDDLASDPDELLDSLPNWLANASSWCELRGKKFLFVIDALNSLSDRRDLRWFPRMLPKHIHLVISVLPGEVSDALQEKSNWSHVSVMPLDTTNAELVFTSYLAFFNKTLPNELVEQVMAHKLSVNPLFLLTLAEELRLFGEHEQLGNRLDHYLTSITVDDLFERVLERIEQDYGADSLREIMTALWAARSGLREEEILGYSGLKPMHWAYIRNALGPTLIDASGRLIFAHDYMRIAVSDRYMAGNNTVGNEGQSEEALNIRRAAHKKLVRWFEKYAFQDGKGLVSDERAAEEIPYQWQQAQDWKKLQTTLTKQKMLIAILKRRSEQELLSYWLKLEDNIKTNIEAQYEKAWKTWKLNEHEEATGDLAQKLTNFLSFAGRWHATFTKKIANLAVQLNTERYGKESELTNKSSMTLARLYLRNGELKNAFLLYRNVLKVEQEQPSQDKQIICAALSGIGQYYREISNSEQAKSYTVQAIEIAEKTFGSEHKYTSDLRFNFAAILAEQQEIEAAEAVFMQVLKNRELQFGKDHPKTATCLNDLALLLKSKGDYERAAFLYRRSLKIGEEKLGSDHPATLTGMNNLATLLHTTGKFFEAETLYRRVVNKRKELLGPAHPATGIALNNLAMLLKDVGKNKDAEIIYRRALEVLENAYGPNHLKVATCLSNLGLVLNKIGRSKDAESICRRALEISEKSLDPDNVQIARSLNNLAQTLKRLGKSNDAEPLYRRALRIFENTYGPDHPNVASCLNNLAQTLKSIGNGNDAEPLFYRAVKISEMKLGPEHPSTIVQLENLGILLSSLKKFELALIQLELAHERQTNINGNNSIKQVRSLLAIAECQYHQARYEEAELSLHKVMSLQTTKYSENSMKLKKTLELLRDVSVALGKDMEARGYAAKVISLDN